MIDNQELTSKDLDDHKGEDLSDKPLPCRKCGELDYDFWDGKGTQAYLTCNECGQEEGIQVTDLYDSVDEWPRFSQRTISYPAYAVEKANKALIAEWNTRADNGLAKLVNTLTEENSKSRYAGYTAAEQLTTTQQALDVAVEALEKMVTEFNPELMRPDCCECNRRDAGAKLVYAKAKAALASIKD